MYLCIEYDKLAYIERASRCRPFKSQYAYSYASQITYTSLHGGQFPMSGTDIHILRSAEDAVCRPRQRDMYPAGGLESLFLRFFL